MQMDQRLLLEVDLLLEQRVHDDRGRTGFLKPFAGIEVVAKRRGAYDQGISQREAEVFSF
jgi:hypothetical protein